MLERSALLNRVVNRIRLIAVRDDVRAVRMSQRVVDNEGRVGQLRRIRRFRAQESVLLRHEHAVAAVLASSHNPINLYVARRIRRQADNDAASGISINVKLLNRELRLLFPLRRHIRSSPFRLLVMEQAYARIHHNHAVVVSCLDDFFVAQRAACLNDVLHAAAACAVQVVAERQERIGAVGYALQAFQPFAFLGQPIKAALTSNGWMRSSPASA